VDPREDDSAPTGSYHHGDLRTALIQAARRVIAVGGVAQLSLRGAARAVGVSPGAPYHHFRSKADLVDAVATSGWMELLTTVAAARRAAATPSDGLLETGAAYVRYARSHPQLYRVMIAQMDSAGRSTGAAATPQGTVLETIKAAGLFEAESDRLSLIALWCVAHGFMSVASYPAVRQFAQTGQGPEDLARRLFKIVLAGLAESGTTPADRQGAP
jgi:AcrR family transcriptional regulator